VIDIDLEEPEVATGGFLSARVRWSSDKERQPRRIVIVAEWETGGAGDRVRGVGRSKQFVPPANRHGGELRVRLLIPHEGPVSFEGQAVSIAWKLWVRIDQWGVDEVSHAEFRVHARRRSPCHPEA